MRPTPRGFFALALKHPAECGVVRWEREETLHENLTRAREAMLTVSTTSSQYQLTATNLRDAFAAFLDRGFMNESR